jgi:outer membrane protein W
MIGGATVAMRSVSVKPSLNARTHGERQAEAVVRCAAAHEPFLHRRLEYAWLSTKATLATRAPVGTVTSTTRLKINPIMTFVSLGYRF